MWMSDKAIVNPSKLKIWGRFAKQAEFPFQSGVTSDSLVAHEEYRGNEK